MRSCSFIHLASCTAACTAAMVSGAGGGTAFMPARVECTGWAVCSGLAGVGPDAVAATLAAAMACLLYFSKSVPLRRSSIVVLNDLRGAFIVCCARRVWGWEWGGWG
jgi:hypothetical protein